MNENMILSLDQPATYQIKLDKNWSEWANGMTIQVDRRDESPPVTTLTGNFDQAALQGLLRRLYSMGLPLISVTCIQWDSE
jgi:hypothetical protein